MITKIKTTANIKKHINLKNRIEWDYPYEDLSEAIRNNEYLILNEENSRIYEVTKIEFYKIT